MLVTKKFKESASAALLDSERMQSIKKKKSLYTEDIYFWTWEQENDLSAGTRSTMNNSNENLSFAC